MKLIFTTVLVMNYNAPFRAEALTHLKTQPLNSGAECCAADVNILLLR